MVNTNSHDQQTSIVTRNTQHGTLTVEVTRKQIDTDLDLVENTRTITNAWVNGVPVHGHSHEHKMDLKNCDTTQKVAETNADELELHIKELSNCADQIHSLVAEHDELSLAASADEEHVTVSEKYLNYHTESGYPETTHRDADTDFKIEAHLEDDFNIYVEVSETAAETLTESLIYELIREHTPIISIVRTPQSPEFEGDVESVSKVSENVVSGQGGNAPVIDVDDAIAMVDPHTGNECVPRELITEAVCAIDCYITDMRGHVGNKVVLLSEFLSDGDIEVVRQLADLDLKKRFNKDPESMLTIKDVWCAVILFARNADFTEPVTEPLESDASLVYERTVGERTTVHSKVFRVREGRVVNDHFEIREKERSVWEIQNQDVDVDIVGEWNDWEWVDEYGNECSLRLFSVPVNLPLVKVC